MVSESSHEQPRASIVGSARHLFARIVDDLFGKEEAALEMTPRAEPERSEPSEASSRPSTEPPPPTLEAPTHPARTETPSVRSAADAVAHLEETLSSFESMLDTLESRTAARQVGAPEAPPAPARPAGLDEAVRETEATLERLAGEAERLAESATGLAASAHELEQRVHEFSQVFQDAGDLPARPVTMPAAQEPRFQPGEQALAVVLAAVPGFQGLMDVQRALSGLPGVESASVVRYKNDEAWLDIVLAAPIAAREIVDRLHDVSGASVLIEEARPEAARLRLRFAEPRVEAVG